jgi:ABC-type lipoprotein release transport system permease subunit
MAMGLLLRYSLGNLATRRLTSALTVLGMALVVFVFAAVLMLAHGLDKTMVETGSSANVIVTRDAATSETVSIVGRDQAGVVTTQPEVAVQADGTPVAVKEIVVLISADKRKNGEKTNVTIRGTSPAGFALRPEIRLREGRMFTPGTSEVVAGRAVARNFQGCGLGENVRFAGREWMVVGVFDAGGTAFDSELWGDAEQVQQAFRRPIFSSVTVRLGEPARFDAVKKRLESDPRMTVEVHREREYYAKQSQASATFIRLIGLAVTILFSAGAVIGAMITMFAAVQNRSVEIGTLRALGFSRRAVLRVFLVESLLLGLAGGLLGLLGAALLSLVKVTTMNWDTFSEVAFGFALSPGIATGALVFAVLMGTAGGFLPALAAAGTGIVDALRKA